MIRKSQVWRLIALAVLVCACYSNSFQAGLVFDNVPLIGHDARIRAATSDNIEAIFHNDYWYKSAPSGLYRPLTTLSYLFNYAILGEGLNPTGYHLFNLLLDVLNVWLVYALGLVIFGDWAAALGMAVLWGVHPVLTESVTNIVGRADLLAAFGVLAGLLCYVRSLDSVGRRRAAWLAALALAQAVGIFSKESAIVLPAVLLLYDLAFVRRTGWRRRVAGYLALVPALALYFYLRAGIPTHLTVHFAENPLAGAGFVAARLTAVKVLGKLIWLFLWPLQLSADYSYNAIPLFGWHATWDDAQAFVALAACVALLVVAIRSRRSHPALCFLIGFFLVTVAPTSNIFLLIGSVMAERFLYLPSIGLVGCLLVGLYSLSRRFIASPIRARHATAAAIAVISLAFAARTWARNADWHDDLTLWTATVHTVPAAARPHSNLCNALSRIPSRLREAAAECNTALQILPDYADAHYNLGHVLAQMPGRLPNAIAQFQSALRIEPAFPQAHAALANALVQLPGSAADAVAEYQAALAGDPDLVEAHFGLGSLWARTPGRLADAETEFETALRIDPQQPKALNGWGDVLSQMPGRLRDAAEKFEEAIALDPNYANAYNNLGNALARMPGRRADAIAEYRAAIRIAPGFADAHYNLANSLAQSANSQNEAIAEYRAAIRANPDMVEAHANLAAVLARIPGQMPAAIAEMEEAVRLRPDPALREMLNRLRKRR